MSAVSTVEQFRARLTAGKAVVGVWSLLPGVATGALLASCQPDYVVVDLQHGSVTEADLPGVISAIRAAGSVPLVRSRSPEFADVGRPLDLGAEGVIVPSIRGIDHAREVLSYMKYSPDGSRSIGRLVGGVADPIRILMIETAGAYADLEGMARLDCDALYVGPADLSLAVGEAQGSDEYTARLEGIVRRCAEAGVPVGVHSHGPYQASTFLKWGAQLINASVDFLLLQAETASHIDDVRSLLI